MFCATSLLIAAPIASAGSGSGVADPSATPVTTADVSSGSAGYLPINIGCLLDALSGGGRTADCNPPSIPVG
ncbi:hypothetical protein C5E41_05810 [Nocardia nova]|nr:hypothetical protein C5E41_05810 [Nocardia nova]